MVSLNRLSPHVMLSPGARVDVVLTFRVEEMLAIKPSMSVKLFNTTVTPGEGVCGIFKFPPVEKEVISFPFFIH